MLFEFALFMDFKLFQMDIKSKFLNSFIAEEVYIKQPPNFESFDFPNHVFKFSKALYRFFTYMLMMLFLVLLTIACVRNFLS